MKKESKSIILSYAGFYGERFEDFISIAARKGFDGVQLIPDQDPNLYTSFDRKRQASLVDAMRQYSLDIHLHNVFYDINIVSVVPEVQENSLKITESVLVLARGLGAKTLTVHPGYMFPGWRGDKVQTARFWDAAQVGMERLSCMSQEYGLTILIENGSYFVTTATSDRRRPLHVGITIEEIERLLAYGDGIGVCLDLGKVRASGIDPVEMIDALSDRIYQFQISNWDDLMYTNTGVQAGLSIVFEGGPGEMLDRFQRGNFGAPI
jgi:sugar phosphate isomerase/epimerase